MKRLFSLASSLSTFDCEFEPAQKIIRLDLSCLVQPSMLPTIVGRFFALYDVNTKSNIMKNVFECTHRTINRKQFVIEVQKSEFNAKIHSAYTDFEHSLPCDRIFKDKEIVRVLFPRYKTLIEALRDANTNGDFPKEFELLSKAVKVLDQVWNWKGITTTRFNDISFLVDSGDNVVIFNYPYAQFVDFDFDSYQYSFRDITHSKNVYDWTEKIQDSRRRILQLLVGMVARARSNISVPAAVHQARNTLGTTEEILFRSLEERKWNFDVVLNLMDFVKSPERIVQLGSFSYDSETYRPALYAAFKKAQCTIRAPDATKTRLESLFRLPKAGKKYDPNKLGNFMMKNMDHHCSDGPTLYEAGNIIGKTSATVGDVAKFYLRYIPEYPIELAIAYYSVIYRFK